MIKVVSFNIDDKLMDKVSFEERFYFEEIPKLISVHHKVSLDKAKAVAIRDYKTISITDPNFYRPQVWFDKFKIKPDWKDIVEDMVHHIQIHREVPESIQKLHKKYQIVFVTKHQKDFLRAKLKVCGLQGDYNTIFSTVDDLNVAKKDQRIYEQIPKILRVQPNEIIHIGDNQDLDHKIPASTGIHTLLLDRRGQKNGVHVISSLKEIDSHISALDKEALMPEPKKPKMVFFSKDDGFEL